jgi:hypothetical protein
MNLEDYDPELHDFLTRSQWKVFELLCRGLSNNEIAEELCISPNTVQGHIGEIYATLCVPFPKRAKAIAYAREHHLFDEPQKTMIYYHQSQEHNRGSLIRERDCELCPTCPFRSEL